MILQLELPTVDVVYFGFILESYEDLALMSTVAAGGGRTRLELFAPDEAVEDLNGLIVALQTEGLAIRRAGDA